MYAAPGYQYAAPLRRWLVSRGFAVHVAPPPETLPLLREGVADAGLAPLGLIAASTELQACPGPMVYSERETMSVLLVSKKPLTLRGCDMIAVTGETRTSILYLTLVLRELGLQPRLLRLSARNAWMLLRAAPCALVIGDEALSALAQGLHVVADMGVLVRDVLGITPVYAATAVARGRSCPRGIDTPPWPRAQRRDVEATAMATGLPRRLADIYHRALLRLDYNPAFLKAALRVLREAVSHGASGGLPPERRAEEASCW
ncbi:MqnA/MqnD/SBP family protein [Pyrodictium abyssi]|uniref:MqnA/MqnD/SBP family protein n=1 Tax=Pyrodictium abyssi TaxID=54256 RepID=UPI0030C74A43